MEVRDLGGGSEAPSLPPSAEAQTPRVGDVLDGRYRITGTLGSGGMGCVYLAVHVSIHRRVALKLLHPEVGAIDEVIRRFEREAFAIGKMDHPNCVQVSDFGKLSDGSLYMVLELLDGLLLFDLLDRETRLDWERALHIARHVLNALDYAHEAGIVHRDIKPENVILVEQDGDPDFAKILDFGIAKILNDDAKTEISAMPLQNNAKLTQQGITIGTPTYIAPEQAYGLEIDPRADLYSLSVMLYELIAGIPPFDADEVGALLRMHVSAEVQRFSEVAPNVDVPEAVERLILHGLAKKVDDRIGSAEEYIERIDEILAAQTKRKKRNLPGLRERMARKKERATAPRKKELAVEPENKEPVVEPDESPSFDIHDLLPRVDQVVPKQKKTKWMLAGALFLLVLTATGALVFFNQDSEPTPEEKPFAAMSLGHSQARKGFDLQALIAYEEALSLDPKLAYNKRMRTNVEQMLDGQAPPEVADAAVEFLGMLVTTANDEAVAVQLIELASSSKVSSIRHAAVRVADEVGLGDQVDLLASYTIDLQQGATCPERKAAVAKLRALGDKRAIPALRKARFRPKKGIESRKTNVNACLKASAGDAIRHLQKL